MNIGDCVCSNIAHTMIGKIIKLLNGNNAIVEVSNKEILVDLNYWHKVNV